MSWTCLLCNVFSLTKSCFLASLERVKRALHQTPFWQQNYYDLQGTQSKAKLKKISTYSTVVGNSLSYGHNKTLIRVTFKSHFAYKKVYMLKTYSKLNQNETLPHDRSLVSRLKLFGQ